MAARSMLPGFHTVWAHGGGGNPVVISLARRLVASQSALLILTAVLGILFNYLIEPIISAGRGLYRVR